MSNRFEETPTVNPKSNEKTVAASRVRMNELVMPNDTNPLGNLMGGRLMQWMDICSVISARRHCNQNVGLWRQTVSSLKIPSSWEKLW